MYPKEIIAYSRKLNHSPAYMIRETEKSVRTYPIYFALLVIMEILLTIALIDIFGNIGFPIGIAMLAGLIIFTGRTVYMSIREPRKLAIEILIEEYKFFIPKIMNTPLDYANIYPWNSIFQKAELEDTAGCIMKFMAEHKENKFQRPSFKEYIVVQPNTDKARFDKVIDYCYSPITAKLFSPEWKKITKL